MDKETQIEELNKSITAKTILTIKAKPRLLVNEDKTGIELNDGYEFEADGSIAEIADGIAKFAKELPNNGYGENSASFFITLIKEYFDRL